MNINEASDKMIKDLFYQKVANKIGINFDEHDFTLDDFIQGYKVELEHGTKGGDLVNITNDDPVMTGKIALAHLLERGDYYERLAKFVEND